LECVGPVQDIDPFDGRMGVERDVQINSVAVQPDDIAHNCGFGGERRGGADARIGGIDRAATAQMGGDVHVHPASGGAVMVPLPHGFKESAARQIVGDETGETAMGAEFGGAGIAGAGRAFVAIAVADQPDPVPQFERVGHDPFEGAPVGVDLDGGAQMRGFGGGDIGGTATHMGIQNAVFVVEGGEQIGERDGVGVDVGPVGQQRVGGAADLVAFIGEEHVVVAAHRRVSGPFIAGENGEFAVAIHVCGGVVDVLPERVCDLKIIGLMRGHIQKCDVAGEFEIGADWVNADGFTALAMQVAPICCGCVVFNNQWVRARQDVPIFGDQRKPIGSGGGDFQPVNPNATLFGGGCDGGGKARDGAIGHQPEAGWNLVGCIAPDVLAADADGEFLIRAPQCGGDDDPVGNRPRTDGDCMGGHGQKHPGGTDIGEQFERVLGFAERLQPVSGRPV
jgi:hypothetical protein